MFASQFAFINEFMSFECEEWKSKEEILWEAHLSVSEFGITKGNVETQVLLVAQITVLPKVSVNSGLN